MARFVLVVGLSGLLLPACSAGEPDVIRPTGQTLTALIASGSVEGVKWRVEVVHDGEKLCLQSVVARKVMGSECGPFSLAADRPVNFVVEGNSNILFVYGVVAPVVQSLRFLTTDVPAGLAVSVVTVNGESEVRYFGYAVRPEGAVDLLAFDHSGMQIYSGGSKIQGTRVVGPTPSAGPSP